MQGDGNEVLVYTNGIHVATLDKLVSTREMREEGFFGRVYDWEYLYWTHTGTLFRLQGQHCLDLLGPTLVLVRGVHSDIWHPRLHVRNPRVVVPLDNSAELSALQVFQLAVKHGF